MTTEPSLWGLARVVVSDQRARHLRILLWISLVTAGFLILVASLGLGTGYPQFAVTVGMPALTLTGFTIAALIHLRRRNAWARLLSAMTGGLMVFEGLLVIRSFLSVAVAGTGVILVVQALRRDDPVDQQLG